MIRFFSLLILSLGIYSLSAQEVKKCKKDFLVMSYNVENLFDTIDNPNKIDDEFLPEGKKNWNTERYNTKLNHLAQVISSVEDKRLPDILGLIEVEERSVLEDLANQKQLKKAKYKIVHRGSPDARGIDVALIYNPKTFRLISEHFYQVIIEDNPKFNTREILYVKGLAKGSKDTLHIFVNHWSSRRGGQEKSEPKRVLAASILKSITDSLVATNNNPKIIIMGDFNDEPNNKSLNETLGAKQLNNINNNSLYNLSYASFLKNEGTYHYWKTSEWNMLDQMIVSGYFINTDNKLQIKTLDTQILRKDFFLFENKDGVKTPSKSYGGSRYYGGYSDHLPIYMYFYYKCKK